MGPYVVRRVLSAIPTLFIIVTISFFLIRLAPGGPFDLERPLEAKVMENLRRIYQLDKPLYEQYWLYLSALARGDLGPSFYFRDFTIAELFALGLPISMRLGFTALAIALVVGTTLGTIAAFRQNRAIDYAVIGIATFGITVPTFVVAPVLQIVFGLMLAWLPVGGWNDGALRNTVMPILTLALPQVAVIARMTRASMIEVLRSNPIRTLRANGLPGSIIVTPCAARRFRSSPIWGRPQPRCSPARSSSRRSSASRVSAGTSSRARSTVTTRWSWAR